jgi:alpha-ketoglutarate-dependent taurine dioxygenase
MLQTARDAAAGSYRRIDVEPVTGALGAEIRGIDLSTLDDQAFEEIYRAFVDHQALIFRDQSLTSDAYLAFACRWGEIKVYPYMKGLPSHPAILEILKTEKDTYAFGNAWHSDQSYTAVPAKATMLYAVEVPPVGGDTQFANMYLAYESLSDGVKTLLSRLKGLNVGGQTAANWDNLSAMERKDPGQVQVRSVHPVVRTHPDTGRKSLYVGSHTVAFDGMTTEESRPLLGFLKAHAVRPEFTCRFRWHPGSLAIWDNRCTLHYATDDYAGRRRRMHRITIEGEEAPY